MVAKDFQGYNPFRISIGSLESEGPTLPMPTPKFPQEIGALLRDY